MIGKVWEIANEILRGDMKKNKQSASSQRSEAKFLRDLSNNTPNSGMFDELNKYEWMDYEGLKRDSSGMRNALNRYGNRSLRTWNVLIPLSILLVGLGVLICV
jgi:hypothetical protein